MICSLLLVCHILLFLLFQPLLGPFYVFTTGEVVYRYFILTLGGCLNIQQILACGGEVSQREEKYT